jgi:hypothetical protein
MVAKRGVRLEVEKSSVGRGIQIVLDVSDEVGV